MSKFPRTIQRKFKIKISRHADTILERDFPEEWKGLNALLEAFVLKRSWLVNAGGNKSALSRYVEGFMQAQGWEEKQFDTGIQADGELRPNPTHKIDCYKNRVALELEWNNKTEFYDRILTVSESERTELHKRWGYPDLINLSQPAIRALACKVNIAPLPLIWTAGAAFEWWWCGWLPSHRLRDHTGVLQ